MFVNKVNNNNIFHVMKNTFALSFISQIIGLICWFFVNSLKNLSSINNLHYLLMILTIVVSRIVFMWKSIISTVAVVIFYTIFHIFLNGILGPSNINNSIINILEILNIILYITIFSLCFFISNFIGDILGTILNIILKILISITILLIIIYLLKKYTDWIWIQSLQSKLSKLYNIIIKNIFLNN